MAKSIANRVIGEARRSGHGIILLHDIHERTIEALPLIIETLTGDGHRFLSWNGEGFVDDLPVVAQTSAPELPQALYHDSWAVLVGIDNYSKWPKLRLRRERRQWHEGPERDHKSQGAPSSAGRCFDVIRSFDIS